MAKQQKVQPTPMQRKVFDIYLDKSSKGEKISIGECMREAGYSEYTSLHPDKVTQSAGWQFLLSQVDDFSILKRVYEIMNDHDKRSSLQAADMLLKLKDRYPAQKQQVEQSQQYRNDVLEG